jgi:anaerobic ribonucleoside-triphosphate reductase activating protein
MALTSPTLNLHGTVARSAVNGPGERYAIWVQGCTLACAGCFNPETHNQAGTSMRADELLDQVLSVPGIEGVTLTGGEPLQQSEGVAAFLRQLRERSQLGVVIITGYTKGEILVDGRRSAACREADVVVAGRYNQRLRLASGLRGSENKSYWFLTERYSREDFEHLLDAEVVISPDGELIATGMYQWEALS